MNGQKSSEGFYTNGEREKTWSFWYENGQKKAEIDYFEGKERIFNEWNEDGTLRKTASKLKSVMENLSKKKL